MVNIFYTGSCLAGIQKEIQNGKLLINLWWPRVCVLFRHHKQPLWELQKLLTHQPNFQPGEQRHIFSHVQPTQLVWQEWKGRKEIPPISHKLELIFERHIKDKPKEGRRKRDMTGKKIFPTTPYHTCYKRPPFGSLRQRLICIVTSFSDVTAVKTNVTWRHRYVTSYTTNALNTRDFYPALGEITWVR